MNRDEVLKYFKGNELATDVWISKYALRDKDNNIIENTPDDMHKRIAKELARIERKYPDPLPEDLIYSLLKNFKDIIPGGSSMYGIGNNNSIVSLGNCFVASGKSDSYGGIFKTDQEIAQIAKRRGGVGTDILSSLRPEDAPVNNSAVSSTGACSFAPRFSNTIREVAQSGRRGALMLTMNISHIDSEKFIELKHDTTKITGANISLKITDEFMDAVENDDIYILHYPVSRRYNHLGGLIPLIKDKIEKKELELNKIYTVNQALNENHKFFDKVYIKPIKAKELWEKIIYSSWKSAEPGILFWDKILDESPADCYEGFETTSTNPCGEIPLCPYDSCRLLSINLFSLAYQPFTKDAKFDFGLLKVITRYAQRIMDDIVDLEIEKVDSILKKISEDPEDESVKFIERQLWLQIMDKLKNGRRTGLGVTGEADVLAALGIKYASPEAITFVEKLHRIIAVESYKTSITLAKERGAFPIWDYNSEKDNPFIKRVLNEMDALTKEDYSNTGRRNIANLTLAPNGTISIVTQVTSGIEPVYELSYKRRRKVDSTSPNKTFQDKTGDWWEEYDVIHPNYAEYLRLNPEDKEGALPNPYNNSTAYEIDVIGKIIMQGAIQQWIDHSISVTHNLPKTITKEQIGDLFKVAWVHGCKGITVYRDGCRDGVLVTNKASTPTEFNPLHAPKRINPMPCDIHTPTIHGQQYVVAVGLMNERPYEIFAFKFNGKFNLKKGFIKKIKRGRYDILDENLNTYSEDITNELTQVEEEKTRTWSWGLRHGADIKFLIEQITKSKKAQINDFSIVCMRTLKKYIKDGEEVSGDICPSCGDKLYYKDGCVMCRSCEYSKCG